MAVFHYKGRDQLGAKVNGHIEAANADGAASQLMGRGITPLDILAGRDSKAWWDQLQEQLRYRSIDLTDLIFFCRQMYTLQHAGVPILQGLRGLQASTRNPAFAEVIGGLAAALDSGLDLTGALRRYSKVFPRLFISLVEVGETTGGLDTAFLQLAQYLELEKETRQRLKSAFRYPSFVLIAIGAALLVINLFVIPSFATVYAGFGAELPWATRTIVAMSEFTTRFWPALLLGSAAVFIGTGFYIKGESGRLKWDRYKLKLPVVGDIIFAATLGRYARILAMVIRSGVPLVQGMSVISRAVDNEYVGQSIRDMRVGVERGESLTQTAAASGLFPAVVLQMLSVGEQTGVLDELMEEVAQYYEREVDYALKNLSTAIEPILIIAIGGLVLLLALGVFLPMWNMASVMGVGGAG
ncbi:MAG: MSHA fimbrial biogenesis protein MshG [Gammaproteobacteria bacterium]|nr:MAG: MSHA fimbrial biogenesis protein MshG [Gammaproteobacteria bacterium]